MKKSQGFTLVELMLYIGLMGFVLVMLIPLVWRAWQFRLQVQRYQVLDRAGFNTLQQLTQKIRFSNLVQVDDINNRLTIEHEEVEEVFYFQNGLLYSQSGVSDPVAMVPDEIEALSFEVSDASLSDDYASVRITLNLQHGDLSRQFATAASRRLQIKE